MRIIPTLINFSIDVFKLISEQRPERITDEKENEICSFETIALFQRQMLGRCIIYEPRQNSQSSFLYSIKLISRNVPQFFNFDQFGINETSRIPGRA